MGSVGGFESPFEQAVASGLRAKGWTAVPQIGVSRFRIDLGIVHPDRAGAYMAGVECDGASYHSAATARDRDKVREAVLGGLGWRLVRVWSTDWWRCRGCARSSRRRAARPTGGGARRAGDPRRGAGGDSGRRSGLVAAEAGDAVAEEAGTEEESATLVLGGDYARTSFAEMADRIDPIRFHGPAYTGTLREMIGRVIAAEAPIRDDLLVERIARAHGFRRSGRVIRDRVMALARAATHAEHDPQGGAGGGAFAIKAVISAG